MPDPPRPANLKLWLGLGLLGLSFLLYGCIFLVPFAQLSTEDKVIVFSMLVISGEASFWIAALLLGRETISLFRCLDPRRWFRRGG